MGWNDRNFNPYEHGITPESTGMNQEAFDREYFYAHFYAHDDEEEAEG